MIEQTQEMRDAVGEAAYGQLNEDEREAVVSAVLALVERDYEPRRCDEPSMVGHRCTKPSGHEHGHYSRFSGTVWP